MRLRSEDPHKDGAGKRVLVTGAAGFVGSHVAERLVDVGFEVIGVDNFDPYYAPVLKHRNLVGLLGRRGFSFREVDCVSLGDMDRALGDLTIQAVVHLAAKVGVRASVGQRAEFARVNVVGTQAVLELARRRSIDRVLLGSSSSVYGGGPARAFREHETPRHPRSPYAATKHAAEILGHEYHRAHGMTVVALRYFSVYGPRQRPDLVIHKFATRLLAGRSIPVYGDGRAERDYTWVDDIAAGTVAAVRWALAEPRAYEIINLGGGCTTSVATVIELLADALGVEPAIQVLPPHRGDMRRTLADLTKARALLGYQPTVRLEEGIPRFLEWLTVGACHQAPA